MSESGTNKKYVELDALFRRADEVVATSVIGRPRRGSGYIPKVDAKIRLNVEVMDWLKAMGPRHYSRINGLLTALMELDKQAHAERGESGSPAEGAGSSPMAGKDVNRAVSSIDVSDDHSSPTPDERLPREWSSSGN